MDDKWISLQPWAMSLKLGDDGIWTVNYGACAIGVVLLAQLKARIIVIQKAAKAGYEFSGAFALPGGIVRGAMADTFEESLNRSLLRRAGLECGIEKGDLSETIFIHDGPWPVTSYTARGAKRFTMVLAVKASLARDVTLIGTDSSVERALWWQPPLPWKLLAPANRLILAHVFSRDISEAERSAAKVYIDEALRQCNGWAAEIGLPALASPWPE
jgi:ADP-ribose pyrophosphatase YjhB (NUDIX family)